MNFLTFVNKTKQEYANAFPNVIFDLIYKLSKTVTDQKSFIKCRNETIDFSVDNFNKLISDYLNKNKPIEKIIKKCRFYKLDLDVFKGILVPRPDTEVLCEKVIDILNSNKKLKHGIDLCSGSGNIAIAIKKSIPLINIVANDVKIGACRNIVHNAKKNDIKIKVLPGNFYKVLTMNEIKYDFVVCNPPYVSIDKLDKSMLKYETIKSFSSDKGNLYFYEKLLANHRKFIKDSNNFLLAFEIGYDQKKQLIKLLKKYSLFPYATFHKDFGNNDRVLIIYKH